MATTYIWNSATSGDWSVPSDWNPSGPPTGTGNSAVINATGSSYTITYDETSGSIGSLLLDSASATLAFTLGDDLSLTKVLTETAGTIDVTSTATLSATSSSTVGGLLDVNNGTGTFSSSVSLTSGGLLTVENGGSVTDHGMIISNGATAVIDSGASLTVSGSLSVSGLLETTSGTGTVTFSSTSGPGMLEAAGGTLDVTSAINSSSGVGLDISDSAASVLEIGGAMRTGNTVTFLGSLGEFDYTGATALKVTVAGLNVGSAETNFVEIAQSGVTVTSGGSGTGISGTVVLSNSDTLTLSGITNAGSGNWYVNTAADGTGTDIYLSSVCYAAGTRILTATGERMIECLMAGDIVLTLQGGELRPRTVKWLGRRRIDLASHPRPDAVAPIRIRRGAVADNLPNRDLLVSPDHALLLDGKLICARQLVNGMTIRQEANRTAVDYYHVELDAHAILLAEGLPAESYLDTGNRGFFANSGEPLILHPDLTDAADRATREAASCECFVWDEANVLPVWQRLADRAAALGLATARRNVTSEPDLRIVADGRIVRPVCSGDGVHVFPLPAGTTDLRLVSRSGLPTDVRPWLDDRRLLGVQVERIMVREAGELQEIAIDLPRLSQGWWAVERQGMVLRRWTNGNAALPVPTCRGPVLLEIRAGSGGMAYLMAEPDRDAA